MNMKARLNDLQDFVDSPRNYMILEKRISDEKEHSAAGEEEWSKFHIFGDEHGISISYIRF